MLLFPLLPAMAWQGAGQPQEYYGDEPYYGNGPFYANRPYYGNGRSYANRPYYSGGRSNYRNYYPGNNDYRGNDPHDKSRLHKVKKDSRDRKDKRVIFLRKRGLDSCFLVEVNGLAAALKALW